VVAVATLATALQRRGRDVAAATGLEASHLRCERAADSAEAWARATWTAPDARPDTTRLTVGGCSVDLTPVFDDTPQRRLQGLILVVRTAGPTVGQPDDPRASRSARFERAWRPQAR